MILGFTGSRTIPKGPDQAARVVSITEHFNRNPATFIRKAKHGMCIGWDAKFHHLCRQIGIPWIDGYPCTLTNQQAECDVDFRYKPLPPIERNHIIVDTVSVMLACPSQTRERFQGSGTWATIRYSLKKHRQIYVIWPDGLVSVNSKLYMDATDEPFAITV